MTEKGSKLYDNVNTPYWKFVSPRYWGIWLVLGFFRLALFLPFSWQLALGRGIGAILFYALPSRRKIARENIQKCLTELDQESQEKILREHFSSLGIGLIETLMCWWGNYEKITSHYNVEGREHLHEAIAKGTGVILLLPHFTHIDICAVFLHQECEYKPIYRPMNNPLFEEITRRGRNRLSKGAIPKNNIKLAIKALKNRENVVLLPDQNFRKKNYEMVPFFGHDAPSNVATSRLATVSGAAVVPMFLRRHGDRYTLRFLPMISDFPTDDAVADTACIHRFIEDEIRDNPSQYLWVHRRFKH